MPWETTQLQRTLTIEFITKRRLNAPVVWLKPELLASNPDDAAATAGKLDTNLEEWRLQSDERNLAARLVDGYIELQIKAPDEVWVDCLFKAFRGRVDGRAAFGLNKKPISSIILKVEDPATIERWAARWPKGHKDKAGGWVETKFAYSSSATKTSKAIWVDFEAAPRLAFRRRSDRLAAARQATGDRRRAWNRGS